MSPRLPRGVGTKMRGNAARLSSSRPAPSPEGDIAWAKSASMADSAQPGFVREIELSGHILDSGVFGRVLEVIMDNEHAHYTIDNFVVGRTETEPSTARLRIEAEDAATLEALLDQLRDIGAFVPDDVDAETEPAPQNG